MRRRVKLLFICRQNRTRSRTAERLLKGVPGYAAKSAGIDAGSRTRVSEKLIAWADVVFVMQAWHFLYLEENFPEALKRKRVVCLHIPDEYQYMAPELVYLLKRALAQHLHLPESV